MYMSRGFFPILAISYSSSVSSIGLSPSVPMFLLLNQSRWLTCVQDNSLEKARVRAQAGLCHSHSGGTCSFAPLFVCVLDPEASTRGTLMCTLPHPPWSCWGHCGAPRVRKGKLGDKPPEWLKVPRFHPNTHFSCWQRQNGVQPPLQPSELPLCWPSPDSELRSGPSVLQGRFVHSLLPGH